MNGVITNLRTAAHFGFRSNDLLHGMICSNKNGHDLLHGILGMKYVDKVEITKHLGKMCMTITGAWASTNMQGCLPGDEWALSVRGDILIGSFMIGVMIFAISFLKARPETKVSMTSTACQCNLLDHEVLRSNGGPAMGPTLSEIIGKYSVEELRRLCTAVGSSGHSRFGRAALEARMEIFFNTTCIGMTEPQAKYIRDMRVFLRLPVWRKGSILDDKILINRKDASDKITELKAECCRGRAGRS